jgi:tetraacyldisaccharide 4'-kinase
MPAHSLYQRIISGEAGLWATPIRAALRGGEVLYRAGVALRNRRYDRKGPDVTLPVEVISVGNITAGGTGKTPFVIDLVTRLDRMGKSPAVVARGYGSPGGEPNDEERLVRRHCPAVSYFANPDRAAAGEEACLRCGADVIVLDDGFQHRRLARALDIVLIDATCPFGHGRLLPGGLLREPPGALRRADAVVITRAGQVSPARIAALDAKLRRLAESAIHLKCHHRVTSIDRIDGTATGESLDGARAVLFAGIGNPSAFRQTALSLGVKVVGQRYWPDHYRYRRRDLDDLLRTGAFTPHDLLLTTEKDAVKLAQLGGVDHARIRVIRIEIDFADGCDTILDQLLNRTLAASGTP